MVEENAITNFFKITMSPFLWVLSPSKLAFNTISACIVFVPVSIVINISQIGSFIFLFVNNKAKGGFI